MSVTIIVRGPPEVDQPVIVAGGTPSTWELAGRVAERLEASHPRIFEKSFGLLDALGEVDLRPLDPAEFKTVYDLTNGEYRAFQEKYPESEAGRTVTALRDNWREYIGALESDPRLVRERPGRSPD